MFSTNLIQSNYGDLNIKSLAFDSFKEKGLSLPWRHSLSLYQRVNVTAMK